MSYLRLIVALALAIAVVACAGVDKRKQAQAHYKIGVSHLNSDKVQPAFVEFQKALDLDPDNEEIHNALGIVYLKLEDDKSAEKSFRKAVRMRSEYSEAHNNLCFLYYTQKRWDEAEKSCRKALKNPLYATPEKAFYNLGRIYYRLGRYDEAIDSFNSALRRYPDIYPAYYGLALAYNAKRMYGEAASAVLRAIEMDPQFKGDRRKAEESFRQPRPGDEQKDMKDYLDILKY